MAWNEPGSNGNDNDPWGGGGRRGGDQGPPDIDEVIKNLTKKFNNLFGGSGSGGSSSGGGSSSTLGGVSGGLIAGLVVVVIVIWGFMGFYIVDEAERGVVLRFGEVLDDTVQPGLHWNPPIIDEVSLVNVSELNAKTYENRAMLTTDENIIDIEVTVQYRIQDPVKYVIAVQNPERSLDNSAESAILGDLPPAAAPAKNTPKHRQNVGSHKNLFFAENGPLWIPGRTQKSQKSRKYTQGYAFDRNV